MANREGKGGLERGKKRKENKGQGDMRGRETREVDVDVKGV